MIEEVTTLASLIDKYGSFVVILSIVLILFIAIIINNNKALKRYEEQSLKNNEAYKNTITDITNKMIEQLLESKDVKEEQKNKEVDLINTFVKLRISMQDKCKESMKSINSDRLAIYLFHNGTHSTHGIKFFKMSCICESIAIGSGIREHSVDHSNIPINLFDSMIDKLINNGRYTIFRSDEINNSNQKMFLSANKIQYSESIAIFDNSNNILGFILAEYSKDYDENTANKQYEVLKCLSEQLVPILAYGDYINININKTQSINQ